MSNLLKTTNYDRFINDPTNRTVSNTKKLISSMEKYGYIPAYPIHVVPHNGRFAIRDGGHRLEAARATGNPVYYVICDKNNISIPEINDAARHWSTNDYVDSHIRSGKREYLILKKFAEDNQIGYRIAAQLLLGNQAADGGAFAQKLKDGTFKVIDYAYASRVASIIRALRPSIPMVNNVLFIAAISKVSRIKGFDVDRFIRNATRLHASFSTRATMDDYLDLIEMVYNDHTRNNRLPIKFLANEESARRKTAGLMSRKA